MDLKGVSVMKILLCPDSFKDCLPANLVANYLEMGLRKVIPNAEIIKNPISDGGEGFCELLTKSCNGKFHKISAVDSLFRPIQSFYGVYGNETAIMDVAATIGLELLSKKERNPLFTSSWGAGLVLKEIVKENFKRIIIGLGGSSTTDGGIGLLSALGFRFLDKNGEQVQLNGSGLQSLSKIEDSDMIKELTACEIITAIDVNNPLYGKNGAAYVFSSQKGASASEVQVLDENVKNFNSVLFKKYGIDCQTIKGSGAAGGIGAGLAACLKATLKSGTEIFIEESNILPLIKQCDLLITGEGEMNDQTLQGKAPFALVKIAKKYKKKTYAVIGKAEGDFSSYFERIYEVMNYADSQSESIKNASDILQRIGEEIASQEFI
jgi:glycerate kinase